MENATDALKMAFAVMIFVMALTVSIVMFSQLNKTSKIVLSSSDVTKFYEYEVAQDQRNRIVGLETIIPTLYKYYKENYTVIFLDKNGNPIKLYETQQKNKDIWGGDSTTRDQLISKYYNGTNTFNVCAFDVDEETVRHEPWTGSPSDYKKNIDAFLNGTIFNYPSGDKNADGTVKNYNYRTELGNTGGFIGKYSEAQFYERIGEYSYNVNKSGVSGTNDLLNGKKKRVIIYQLVN